jgi:hypothetical protein
MRLERSARARIYLQLPPLPPDAPTVEQRLRLIVEGSGHRDASGPIESFAC